MCEGTRSGFIVPVPDAVVTIVRGGVACTQLGSMHQAPVAGMCAGALSLGGGGGDDTPGGAASVSALQTPP
jgi:hypothetical protein